ncbi:MAG: hypothetical protein GWO16_05745 [Gammaproteobacteria bacterium]|nr:hypothetical protein [Gammaproteobacteria bacterium]NIR97547.1 hypothetical protein [Gammaproteobacteria bacterium]NIT63185.1 hypothetical protein [Gammaproteobacteria bacterium]NIV20133.1 hypothetical protein [Gammaproteobacteria bacterium]NIX10469.1 hypothetical protein [Gammaproteobacteria bacterium]
MHDIPTAQSVAAVLWPSFLVAGLATVLFFTAFDPAEIMAASGYGEIDRTTGYTVGFFLFWLLTASSCLLTCYFQQPCDGNAVRRRGEQRPTTS